jgi:hypothetical protein
MFVAHNFVPDRACITEAADDGSEILNATIRSGEYTTTLTITPENREAIMREGWIKFANLPPEALDIKPPRGSELRKNSKGN